MRIQDFTDMHKFEEIMQNWAKATGLATVAVDIDGTYLSDCYNFTDFCMKYTRQSPEGKKRCEKCDKECSGVYRCHAGLIDFSIDLTLDGEKLGAFEELLDIKDQCKYANELDSTGAVLAKVASTPGSIGYVSLDVLDDTVSALSIDGVEATEDNIVAGDYKLSRPFVMATKGEISEQSEAVQTFFDYINSDEGQAVIKKVGLILPQ